MAAPSEAGCYGVKVSVERALEDRLHILLHGGELPAAVREDHLLRGRENLEGDLEGAVPAADDDHPFVLELMAVPGPVLDALAFQFRLARHVEPLRLEQAHPHREKGRPRLEGVPFAGGGAEAPWRPFGGDARPRTPTR